MEIKKVQHGLDKNHWECLNSGQSKKHISQKKKTKEIDTKECTLMYLCVFNSKTIVVVNKIKNKKWHWVFGRIRLFCCCHPPDSEEPYWLHRTSHDHRLCPMVAIHWLYECLCEKAISTNANTTAQRSVGFGKKNMKYTKQKTQTTLAPPKSSARTVTNTHHTK